MRTVQPEAAAGHSLGEYSALVSAGAIQFYDAIKFVRERGKAMQQAGIEKRWYYGCCFSLSPEIVEEFVKKLQLKG